MTHVPLPNDRTTFLLGRGTECDVCIPDDRAVSRRHALLVRGAGGWTIRDLGSANGTAVNRQRVVNAALAEADHFHVGAAECFVRQGNIWVPSTAVVRPLGAASPAPPLRYLPLVTGIGGAVTLLIVITLFVRSPHPATIPSLGRIDPGLILGLGGGASATPGGTLAAPASTRNPTSTPAGAKGPPGSPGHRVPIKAPVSPPAPVVVAPTAAPASAATVKPKRVSASPQPTAPSPSAMPTSPTPAPPASATPDVSVPATNTPKPMAVTPFPSPVPPTP